MGSSFYQQNDDNDEDVSRSVFESGRLCLCDAFGDADETMLVVLVVMVVIMVVVPQIYYLPAPSSNLKSKKKDRRNQSIWCNVLQLLEVNSTAAATASNL